MFIYTVCKISEIFSNFAKELETDYRQFTLFMKAALLTILLLVISNIFMTFAWYGHLKLSTSGISKDWPLIAVIIFSWGIAFLEYCFMVPANKIGFEGNGGPFSLFQLKIIHVDRVYDNSGALFPGTKITVESCGVIYLSYCSGGVRFPAYQINFNLSKNF